MWQSGREIGGARESARVERTIVRQEMRQYETLYVLQPQLEEKAALGLMRKMKTWVEQQEGKNVQVLCWGRKKLAWQRLNYNKGTFVQHTYVGKPGIANAYDRLLAIDEQVLLRQSVLLKSEVDPDTVQPQPDHLSFQQETSQEGEKETVKKQQAQGTRKPQRQEQSSAGEDKDAAPAAPEAKAKETVKKQQAQGARKPQRQKQASQNKDKSAAPATSEATAGE